MVTPQQLDGLRRVVQRFQSVTDLLYEAVFPCQERVFLQQILSLLMPIYSEFTQLMLEDTPSSKQ